jgi:hypothetical protein
MKTHFLKTWPSAFEDVIYGRKTFEFRLNDRDFCMGDKLVLLEWDPLGGGKYTLAESHWVVGYILHGGQFGVPVGYCIMSLKPPAAAKGETTP